MSAVPEGGSYEVIRTRLGGQAKALRDAAEKLNQGRKAAFGGTELALLGNVRVRTENNCVPRDIVPVGDSLLFGYNVFIGLKTEIKVEDVFSLQKLVERPDGFDVEPRPHAETFLAQDGFVRDFREIYKYYKETKLDRVRRVEGKLLACFQTGATLKDLKVLRFAVSPDGAVSYIDSRGERDDVYPPSHDFEWTKTGRENHVSGRHPHVSIQDKVFVETVGGDLTVKVENNTETGKGIYREPVEDANQSLDDGEIWYAAIDALILLKIKPFREDTYRYLVFNQRTQKVDRIDAIGISCVQLPEGHGLVFPGGYYLQSGETKSFDIDTRDLQLQRVLRSPNGEDVLYLFRRAADGSSILLAYNLIRKEVANAIRAHGASIFADGTMIVFQATSDEPTRVHPMQIWRTPFKSVEHAAAEPRVAGFFGKVGNPELVRGISDALTVARVAETEKPTRRTWDDLIGAAQRTLDAYHWLGESDAGGLSELVRALQGTAELIVDEFDKAETIRQRAVQAVDDAEKAQAKLILELRPEDWRGVDKYLDAMVSLRKERGHLVTMRDLRGVDLAAIDRLEAKSIEELGRISRACVDYLVEPAALAPLIADIQLLLGKIEAADKSAQLVPLAESLARIADGLAVLTEVMSGLDVEDPTAKTRILEAVSEVYAQSNRVRGALAARTKELGTREGRAEFAVQFKLFAQSVDSALGQSDTPEKCDAQLSRMLVQLEDLEGRFGELDEFLGELASQREHVVEAFGAKKQTLVDERQRRAQNLIGAAERIVAGISRRAFKDADELNGYFAADPMVMKLRQIGTQLLAIGDSVKADEVGSKLKSAKQDALRALRDRADLYAEGGTVIQLGRHKFNVNTQPFEMSVVPRGDGMALHLAGTDFYELITDPKFLETRAFWNQQLVSETDEVYRAEYLAATILFDAEKDGSVDSLKHGDQAALLALVRRVASERYDEGYERGLHDADATKILERLLALRASAGLLRYSPEARSAACVFWAYFADDELKSRWQRRARSLGRLRDTFGTTPALRELAAEIAGFIAKFSRENEWPAFKTQLSGEYLVEELAKPSDTRFVLAREAVALRDALLENLGQGGAGRAALEEDLASLDKSLAERASLVRAWLEAFLGGRSAEDRARFSAAVVEATALVLTTGRLDRVESSGLTGAEIHGLLGQHRRIVDRTLKFRLDEFVDRLRVFVEERAPAFRAFRTQRAELVERERKRLRVDELMPKVLTSFVRNKLISEVYLPIVGDNLAKQLGAAGEKKRTDLMGLLLVVSPPGYGKTTLMEYVANRLGMIFMKINGPALGHEVTSIDPAEAPNATARQEVEKINLGLEMGNNVMLYLDDIQHNDPELLQKFISLCDAQRKIEGVWNGRTRTYDLRGKKFCVVMAGNPYTESGETFRIPDMLANRADTHNLGDVLSGKDEIFALSYLENAMTSSSTLAPLAGRPPADIQRFIKMARGDDAAGADLEHPYSAAEREEIVAVMKRLFKVQVTLLAVNKQYIESASQDDAYRSEPPFKLQGSYRNMNKLTEKIVSVMTDEELDRLVDDHYRGESQTLTNGAEQNLLKLAEIRGKMTPAQRARWDEVKRGFKRVQIMGSSDADPVARVTAQLSSMASSMDGISSALTKPRAPAAAVAPPVDATLAKSLEGIAQSIRFAAAGRTDKTKPADDSTAKVALENQLKMHEEVLQAIVRASRWEAEDMRAINTTLGKIAELLKNEPAS